METKEITMDYLLEQIEIESGDTALDYVYDNELREYHNDYPFNNVDELAQYLYDEIDCKGGFNIDIIYYYKAMEYLMQNDVSLSDSMEIASDMGYEVSKLNSEVLASIHASHYARINFIDDNAKEIEQLFESLNK